MNLKTALDTTAKEVEEILISSPFPVGIEPEFLRRAVLDYPLRGGKRLRPALTLWSCALLGGESKPLHAAAAIEVFHNFTLVHDDIIDDDAYRRGVPACHTALANHAAATLGLNPTHAARFGRDFAILAGDLQIAWATSLMLASTVDNVSPELAKALAARLQDYTAKELISGEALDVHLSYRALDEISLDEVERMYQLKTGVLLAFAAETGAMIALNDTTCSAPETTALGRMAMAAAVGFQMRDDYLGIFGDAAKFGKPLGSDLSERKVTWLLLKALAQLPDSGKRELSTMLGKAEYTPDELDRARQLLTESGAVTAAIKRADELTAIARNELARMPQNSYKALISDLLDYLLARNI